MRHQRTHHAFGPNPAPRAHVRAPRRRREEPRGARVLGGSRPSHRARRALGGDALAPGLGVQRRHDSLADRDVRLRRDAPGGRAADQRAEGVERVPRGVPRAAPRAARLSFVRERARLTSFIGGLFGYFGEERGDERVDLLRREVGAALLQQLRERLERVLRGARVLVQARWVGQHAAVVRRERGRDLLVQMEPLRAEEVPDEGVEGAAAAGGRLGDAVLSVLSVHRAHEEEDVRGYLRRGGVAVGRGAQPGAVLEEGSGRGSERVA